MLGVTAVLYGERSAEYGCPYAMAVKPPFSRYVPLCGPVVDVGMLGLDSLIGQRCWLRRKR